MNYAHWLSNIPGVGIRSRNRILAFVGNAEEVYHLTREQLQKIPGMEEKQIQSIIDSKNKDWEKDYAALGEKGITFLSREEELFPKKLRTIPDAPYSLYLKGKLPPEGKTTVAIVGARRCSSYGYAMAEKLGRELTKNGAVVISGMASGIDAGGHWGAIQGNGETYAVFGCGVRVCYPHSNQKLYQQILQCGGLLSEYPPDMQPMAALFPARNRIISGLSDAVVIVEAKTRSGSLITADYALEQGKDIYAVPGRVTDDLSAGCNSLIGQGAGIISDVEEFLKELRLCGQNTLSMQSFNNLLLEKDESLVYSCLSLRPKNVEELLHETGFAMPGLADVLMRLMEKEFIAETAKNYYIRRI